LIGGFEGENPLLFDYIFKMALSINKYINLNAFKIYWVVPRLTLFN